VTASVASLGVMGVMGVAGAQRPNAPGVSDDSITVGYISAQTGPGGGASTSKACEARVKAQNATGGVNGRKIDLQLADDMTSSANLTAAQDLVRNRNAFVVVDNSALAFLTWRFLKEQGVPMIGGGYDGSYYYNQGNESIISALGDGTPVPGLTYDFTTKMMKQMGAKKVAAIGYKISPSSSESAKAVETYGAKANGLEGVYLNTALDFGSDVSAAVLGIKNSGADATYLPLGADANVAIVQGLQQNGVRMKANVLGTGYSQALLDQPIAKTITPRDLMFTAYQPVELGGKAVNDLQSNLKKYSGLTGVPDYGTYTGYITCDLMIEGLKGAGKNLTRQGFVDAIRKGGPYDGAGLLCEPLDLSYQSFGKIKKTGCAWFVNVQNGKFKVLNGGKPVIGKLVGDPQLLAQYVNNSGGVTTTAAATASP
jgi:ABC-type branched-subunit amino acid transport system substrate-binding protein